MPTPATLAQAWLTPPALSFWKWSDGGRALAWCDGATIAFREELDTAMTALSTRGFPPSGALVLLLAACSRNWRDSGRDTVLVHARALERVSSLDGRFAPSWLPEVLVGLDAVSLLRPELRSGPEAKAVLADLVFEPVEGRGTPEDAAGILSEFHAMPSVDLATREPVSKWVVYRFLHDLSVLRQGLGRVDAATLELRRRSGLDTMPVPASIEDNLPVADAVRRLIAELRDDHELAGFARLAQDLMAAVHVPRRLSDPEELPLGGVSDIANRGPLDRLLVSELAHDETVLAARIALNEALFLRREAPPQRLPTRRAILIDAGIRMWGVPRLFGAAVAMALAATAERGATVDTWRATPDGLRKVDFSTREGLMSHLEALEATPAPVEALSAFLKDTAGSAEPLDAILVTHPDTLSDPALAPALELLGDRALDAATVDRHGVFRMTILSRRGRRVAREAHLSLKEILSPPRTEIRGSPLLPADPDPAFPLILSTDPFPFLLPHEIDPRRAAPHPRLGVVAATRDGRLMHWTAPRRGARQLTALLPRGTLHSIVLEDDGMAYAVVGSSRASMHLVVADVESGRCSLMRLPATDYPPRGIFRHQEALFLAYDGQLDVFDIRTGELREVHPLPPGARWSCHRYFWDPQGWSVVSFDGQAAAFTPVPMVRPRAGAGVVALFDRPGVDGPWALTTGGSVVSIADGREIRFAHGLPVPVRFIAVSRDGNRVAFSAGNTIAIGQIDSGRAQKVYGEPLLALEPAINALTRRAVSHRFHGISADGTGGLLLVRNGGDVVSVRLDEGTGRMFLSARRAATPLIERAFVPGTAPRGTRYALKVASWKDGSRAWLDTRGLLHLKSSESRVPEVCLALAMDGPTAGWSSDGRLAGDEYFTGSRTNAEPHGVWTAVHRFLQALS